jgi:hypothetical protein
MNPASNCAVTECVTMTMIDGTGAATPVVADLSYDPTDPYAVAATFVLEHMQVSWTFARDLLITGVHEPTGDGDVRVWPGLDPLGHALVNIEISSTDGVALLQARSSELHPFVDQMKRVVRPGAESTHVDIDAALAAILV